jgi:hypothetical protein
MPVTVVMILRQLFARVNQTFACVLLHAECDHCASFLEMFYRANNFWVRAMLTLIL